MSVSMHPSQGRGLPGLIPAPITSTAFSATGKPGHPAPPQPLLRPNLLLPSGLENLRNPMPTSFHIIVTDCAGMSFAARVFHDRCKNNRHVQYIPGQGNQKLFADRDVVIPASHKAAEFNITNCLDTCKRRPAEQGRRPPGAVVNQVRTVGELKKGQRENVKHG